MAAVHTGLGVGCAPSVIDPSCHKPTAANKHSEKIYHFVLRGHCSILPHLFKLIFPACRACRVQDPIIEPSFRKTLHCKTEQPTLLLIGNFLREPGLKDY